MSASLSDLQAKVQLDQTLMLTSTEFGSAPRIDGNDGRDQQNWAFTSLLAGAGIECGEAVQEQAMSTLLYRGSPSQGAAAPDARDPGHRVRPHAPDQRQRRAGPPQLVHVPADRG